MGGKSRGRVRLRDPSTGLLVWVDRAAIHSEPADESAEPEVASPAQADATPGHASSSATPAPASTPPAVPSTPPAVESTPKAAGPRQRSVDPDEIQVDDDDEPDEIGDFLGEPRAARARASSRAPAELAPAKSRRSTGADVFDFWFGDGDDGEPAVVDP